jgi:proteasome lid subunit RPN8/RPN11
MSETKFGAWTVPEAGVAIEYSLVVIEEIRQAVSEGFQRFARGGIEVGGVLYGAFDGLTARILAVREIACEHARGPSFSLSDKDRAELREQLERDRHDARLEGFTALGFYVSHTRSDIALLPADLEIFDLFFPKLSQVALVVRPGRGGTMRAGFFVREANGAVKTERSYLDFNFPDRVAIPHSPPPSLMDRHPRERTLGNDRRSVAAYEPPAGVDTSDAPLPLEFPFPGAESSRMAPVRAPDYAPVPSAKRSWLAWGLSVAGVLVVAVLAVAGLRFFNANTPREPLALAVYEHDSQLRIEWNHASATIRDATQGTVEIVDGKDTQTVPLNAEDLARGSFTYMRRTGDIQVRMEVQNSAGIKTQEASRFLGVPPRPIAADELETTKQERDTLQADVKRLRDENARQADHVRQLERTLTILRTRLGIVNPSKK